MNHSWHVPRSTVQKIYAVAKWITPAIGTGLLTLLGFGWGWLMDRTSVEEVSPKIAEVRIAARAAQETAHSASNKADQALALAVETARMQAELWGQAVVERAYNTSSRRQEYIERARAYYLNAFDDLRQSTQYQANPAGALERIRRMTWRPDRGD